MKKVLILYKSLPQYRLAFFNEIRNELAKNNIILELIYGDADTWGSNDNTHISWALFKKNKIMFPGSLRLIWQPCIREIKNADLVIVEQANKLLINYFLMLRKVTSKGRFAFWGHGLDMQSSRYSVFNLFKRVYTNYCDWWFAYTCGVKSFLIDNGYSGRKITVVENAIDTRQLSRDYENIMEDELIEIREKYSIQKKEKVLIYCGALYKEKRLEFLISAADELVKLGHSFKLLIVGGGTDEFSIRKAAATRPWLIMTGPQFDRQKAALFKLADLFLLPGAMGLAVLDSFALETPIVTTKYRFHGPEFEYLVPGYNGIVTEDNLQDYVTAVSNLLLNTGQLEKMKINCRADAKKYTNENMVSNFVYGVKNALRINT
jgi:glycosyltransferase involved in cell wall biosynthesis